MQHSRVLHILCLCFGIAITAWAQRANAPTGATQQHSSASPATTAGETGAANNEADPLMDLPPLPKGDVSLVGGIVAGVDRVRSRLTVEAFGGKKMKFAFDERTHIYRDGIETTQLGIRKGDRVYVDTQLVGSTVFARNIRVGSQNRTAFAQGQIQNYDAGRGTIVLLDSLSSEPVTFRVTPNTVIRGKATSIAELREGALVDVKFAPDSGKNGIAQEITMTARPGDTFRFSGNVTFLDVRSGTLAVRNQSDGKTYEIRFDPTLGSTDNLSVASNVTISAEFDGKNYHAKDITVTQAKDEANR